MARRIGRATKARNWSAHPDARLLVRDVARAVKNGSVSGVDSQSTMEADSSEKTELSDTADVPSEKADDCSEEAVVDNGAVRELADEQSFMEPVAKQEGEMIKEDIKCDPDCKVNVVCVYSISPRAAEVPQSEHVEIDELVSKFVDVAVPEPKGKGGAMDMGKA